MTGRADAFKREDASSYDPLARTFDRLSDRFTAPLAQAMVELAGIGPSDRVLDVGTGSGIVALRAAAGAGLVVGVDLSEGMLATARTKAGREGLDGRLHFCRMDAEALALPSASFDVVVSLFALLHLPDPRAAVSQMRRVLKPGGRLVLGLGSPPPLLSGWALKRAAQRALSWGRSVRGLELAAPQFLDRLVDARLPAPMSADETELAQEAHHHSPDLRLLVRSGGLQWTGASWKGGEARIETAEEFWELQRTYSSRSRKRLARGPEEAVAALRQEFLATARSVIARGGRLVYRYGALFVMARCPSGAHA